MPDQGTLKFCSKSSYRVFVFFTVALMYLAFGTFYLNSVFDKLKYQVLGKVPTAMKQRLLDQF